MAFLILPGLVAEVHRSKKVPAGHLLHGLASLVDTLDSDLAFANSIVGEAVRLAPYVRAQREAVAQSGGMVDGSGRADATVRRIESLVRGKKLGPAMRQLDLLQDIVNGEGNRAAVLSIPEFRDIYIVGHERGGQ